MLNLFRMCFLLTLHRQLSTHLFAEIHSAARGEKKLHDLHAWGTILVTLKVACNKGDMQYISCTVAFKDSHKQLLTSWSSLVLSWEFVKLLDSRAADSSWFRLYRVHMHPGWRGEGMEENGNAFVARQIKRIRQERTNICKWLTRGETVASLCVVPKIKNIK